MKKRSPLTSFSPLSFFIVVFAVTALVTSGTGYSPKPAFAQEQTGEDAAPETDLAPEDVAPEDVAPEEGQAQPDAAAGEDAAAAPDAGDEQTSENDGASDDEAGDVAEAGEDQATEKKSIALSLTGTPKYGPDTKNFDYVNVDAPKGGSIRLFGNGSFDSLNPFTTKGTPAAALLLTFDQMMSNSMDEGSSQYCHLCEWVSYPADYSSVTFKLREGPKFHDGKPVTAEDVIFSLTALKEANPRYRQYYKNVVKAEKTGERQVTFTFDVKGNRELPFIVGELYILPAHYWAGKDKDGEPRDLGKTTLEVPLGSGPYKVKDFTAGQRIAYQRYDDYWGKDLFTAVGHNNFDEIRYEYFRDQSVAFEAFKGDQFDFYYENSSINWARNYEFSAVEDGRVVKRDDIVLENPQGMQGFVFNTRRDKFADRRVREALSRAFDFEWAAKNLFYNQYKRTTSYFENSELASSGPPSEAELALLRPLKDNIPPEVLTQEYKPFTHDEKGGTRQQLRAARKLLREAGWTIQKEVAEDASCGFFCQALITIGLKSPKESNVLRNKDGDALKVEFLIVAPAFQRIIQSYVGNLKQLGVQTSIRLVDSAQYQKRLETFDFDVVISSFGQSESPGNEQRFYWGSEAADTDGSRNLAGIKNPAIDKLIDQIIFAKSREELVTATRALDRVLLFSHYVVPNWHTAYERIAYWDRFGQPANPPSRSVGHIQTWWYDADKATALAAKQK